MNALVQNASVEKKNEEPLFASPWLALFVILRRELAQAFNDRSCPVTRILWDSELPRCSKTRRSSQEMACPFQGLQRRIGASG